MLAELRRQQGDGHGRLGLIARAKGHIDSHDEPMWQAEVQRIEGELLRLQEAAPTEIETCFRRSLSTAKRQGAKSFELRAATSLARFWRDQGRNDAARDELAPVLGWFTEGFDTVDVQQTRTLLNELS